MKQARVVRGSPKQATKWKTARCKGLVEAGTRGADCKAFFMGQSSEVKQNVSETKGPLAALLVEDSPLDAELLARHLHHNGYELSYRRVDSSGAFRQAIQEQKWDIILCDYQMPAFGVEAAL